VKAITAAQLSMASHGVYSVTLDEAIEAMRLTAADMSVKYKETSLSVCVFRCVMRWLRLTSHITGTSCKYKSRKIDNDSIVFNQSSQRTVRIPLTVPAWCVDIITMHWWLLTDLS
jgi:hypothetical protein